MSISVERLRIWLLVGAGLLVLVIGAFLGYAHWRAHRFLTDLPKKLGVDIRRETNGFTYSQSVQGRTVYTIHAAKAVERLDGKMTLHDVGIVLYGREQNRADRIYGNEFEYDQKGGVIRAVGEVHIDLQAPEATDANAKMDYAAGKDLHGDGKDEEKDERLIHVKTSGLVYVQKLGVAATDSDIEFASGGMIGHAVGADYNSDTGLIVLRSAVRVNGVEHDRPVVLTASRAELDRQNERVILSQAKYVTVGGTGKGAAGEMAEGQHVVVHLRKDGTVERLEAEGNVTLTNGESGKVVAPRGEMTVDESNKPLMATMSGGLKYVADDPLRQAQGEASEGKTTFDKAGKPEHAVMTGAVHLHEKVRASDAVPWDERELNAQTVDLALGSDAAGKTFLRDAKASGSARLTVVSAVKGGGVGTTASGMAGDVLTAHFVRVGEADHISEVHGDGHALLRKEDVKGVVNTSSADSLVAHFHALAPGTHDVSAKGAGTDEIADATEQGHVVMMQMPVRKPGDAAAPVPERASAERAVYDGALERTTLTGNVQVSDGANVLWADRVVTEQQSGDATADGSVKASYIQAGSSEEPVHVLASRAEMKHDSQTAIFYGTAGRLARLWQGGSQVDAPVLQFEQKQKRLLAHGDGQGAPLAVHTVLVSNGDSGSGRAGKRSVAADGKAGSGKAGAGKIAGGGKTGVVRVASRELVYSDETRRADFTGGVEVESADGVMKGQQVVVYLEPAQAGATGATKSSGGGDAKQSLAAGGFMGGSVERIVASGHIDMQQPGRRATGEQLVYTAIDGMFALTGTTKVPPKVVDAERGTVTGTLLRFHSGDENVVVSNGGDSADRVRTETRVKNKQ
jgi:lipopolysaccharide export system protein LptA